MFAPPLHTPTRGGTPTRSRTPTQHPAQTPLRRSSTVLPPSTPLLRYNSTLGRLLPVPAPRRPSSIAQRPGAAAPPYRPGSAQLYRPGSAQLYRPGSAQLNRPGSAQLARGPSLFRPQTPVQAYTGTIHVLVRPKPVLDEQRHLLDQQDQHDPFVIDSMAGVVLGPDVGDCHYDLVFDPLALNREVYQKTVQPIIHKVMAGYNGTVFAYGMTSSGKTHLMQGSLADPGIIPQAVAEVFAHVDRHRGLETLYAVLVSYLEIYNERLVDLLAPTSAAAPAPFSLGGGSSGSSTPGGASGSDLRIRDDPLTGVKVLGLREELVSLVDQLMLFLHTGDAARKTSATDFNAHLSRLHAVVMLRVVHTEHGVSTYLTLSLCDLAGLERATAQSERRKEGAYINKLLLTLLNVISKLLLANSSGPAPPGPNHIPYRESKLTRLLQPALSGDALVCVLCTIQLTVHAKAETVNTLRFAARAKNVVLHAKKNEVLDLPAAQLEQLMAVVERQQQEIERLKAAAASAGTPTASTTQHVRIPSASGATLDEILRVTAENMVLTERVEHLMRLEETGRAEQIIVRNDVLNLVTRLQGFAQADPHGDQGVGDLMVRLEEQFTRHARHVEESKLYIRHLEKQLFQAEEEKLRAMSVASDATVAAAAAAAGFDKEPLSRSRAASIRSLFSASPQHTNRALMEQMDVMRDQEEEIMGLQEQLKDKDRIIRALKLANRLRDLLAPNKWVVLPTRIDKMDLDKMDLDLSRDEDQKRSLELENMYPEY